MRVITPSPGTVFAVDEPEYLGLARDPWPYDYIINGLYFFAMNATAQRAYVPELRAPVHFDMGGDQVIRSGLEGVVAAFAECIAAGRGWNEIVDPDELDPALPELFAELVSAVDKVLEAIAAVGQPAQFFIDDRLSAALDDARTVARAALARTRWADEHAEPLLTGREILSAWSRGLSDELTADTEQPAPKD